MAPLALILLHLSIVPVFMPSVGIGAHGQEIISNAIRWSAVVQDQRAQIPVGALLERTWRVK